MIHTVEVLEELASLAVEMLEKFSIADHNALKC